MVRKVVNYLGNKEDNEIDWCPDDMFGKNQDVIIFGEDEYNKAIKLLGR